MNPRRAILSLSALLSGVAIRAGEPAGTTVIPSATPGIAGNVTAGTDPSKPPIESGPAIGWVFPVFTDKDGYHWLTLRGSAARIVSANEIDVTGFSAVVFSGDATERVETVLLSPQASFFPKTDRAKGSSTVRVIYDDVEVTGRGWTYDHNTKIVSLAHDVRVTFHAQINDILK